MKNANRLIISILAIGAIAVAFFVLALSPKQQEVSKLNSEAEQLQTSIAESRATADRARAAESEFPTDYRQLVVLGEAVPSSDETSSLLVELQQIAERSGVGFQSIQLNGSGEAAAPVAPVPTPEPSPTGETPGAVPAAATVPPSEAAASLLPLGASVGSASLAVMPYDLTFSGDFFQIADFIHGLDSLVSPSDQSIDVNGRLMTINSFALTESADGYPALDANFSVTTYLTPPSQGVTAGATPTAPAPSTATPAASAEGEVPPEATTVSTE